jgi:outer membrane protein assembly factor BamB
MNYIDMQSQWDNGFCPAINGIVYADGRVSLFVVSDRWNDNEKRPDYQITPGEHITIQELANKQLLHWSSVGRAKRYLNIPEDDIHFVRLPAINKVVVVGGGSWGDDGFVALCNSENGAFIWIAFFTCSNPFEKVRIENDIIIATNNHGNIWKFPIDNPENITVD